MLKKAMIPMLAVAAGLMFVPNAANAGVRFGVYLGGPPVVVAPPPPPPVYVDPYYGNYADPYSGSYYAPYYSYPAYGYGYGYSVSRYYNYAPRYSAPRYRNYGRGYERGHENRGGGRRR